MLIFGVNPVTDVNWYLFWYVVFAITFLVVGFQNLYSTGMTAATTVFTIGSVLVFVYFGLRWYGKGEDSMPSVWPPVINMCPDYLTYMPNLPGCIDMLGVTRTSGGLTRTLPSEVNNLQRGNANKVFEYTSEDVRKATSASDIQRMCDRCKTAGITWEGVYDGDSCVGITTVASANSVANASGNCSYKNLIYSDVNDAINTYKSGGTTLSLF